MATTATLRAAALTMALASAFGGAAGAAIMLLIMHMAYGTGQLVGATDRPDAQPTVRLVCMPIPDKITTVKGML